MSEADLLSRLVNFEDQFVERKTVADLNDSLKTVVGFANSAPIGVPCILYIGVRDDGQFETKAYDFDLIQKSLNRLLQKTYPRVPYFPKIITNGLNTALAVIVYGSHQRPHFSGPSYIRRGSETCEASDSQLDALIAMRSGKVYYLLQNVGNEVTAVNLSVMGNGMFTKGFWGNAPKIVDCNEFWITLQSPNGPLQSFGLHDVALSFDHGRNRLQLEITNPQL